MNDYEFNPAGLILECPFGSLYKTTCARFRAMGVPSFPMAGLLVFWGGVQNGFWPFSFKPERYARKVNCPTLLMYGQKDHRVSRSETDIIFLNLEGTKSLKIFTEAGHEDYHIRFRQEWIEEVARFLK